MPLTTCPIWQATPEAERDELMSYLHEVRTVVCKELAQVEASRRLSRLCLSDIAETLSARAISSLIADMQFPSQASKAEKKLFLTTCLRISLLHWLMSKAENRQELELLNTLKLPSSHF